jgi:hypothetical protein
MRSDLYGPCLKDDASLQRQLRFSRGQLRFTTSCGLRMNRRFARHWIKGMIDAECSVPLPYLAVETCDNLARWHDWYRYEHKVPSELNNRRCNLKQEQGFRRGTFCYLCFVLADGRQSRRQTIWMRCLWLSPVRLAPEVTHFEY